MGLKGYRRRILVGALTRPDSVGYWITEQLRMRRNRRREFAFPADSREFLSPGAFVSDVLGSASTTEKRSEEINELYSSLSAQVNQLYGYNGVGRSPSTIDEFDAIILHSICRILKPALVVETGVSDGMSSAIILDALCGNDKGRLVSIDFPIVGVPRLYGKPPGWVVPDRLRGRWTLLTGRSRRILPAILSKYGPLDLFFHDSEHSYECMKAEFEVSMKCLSPGGVVLSDDATVSAALLHAADQAFGGRSPVLFSTSGMGGVRNPRHSNDP